MSCCRHCPTIAQGMLHACQFDGYVQRRGQLWWSVSSLLAIQKCDGGKIQFYYIRFQKKTALASSSPRNRRRQISLPCALGGTDGVGLQDLVLWGGQFLLLELSQNSLESIIFWKICYSNGLVGTVCLCNGSSQQWLSTLSQGVTGIFSGRCFHFSPFVLEKYIAKKTKTSKIPKS